MEMSPMLYEAQSRVLKRYRNRVGIESGNLESEVGVLDVVLELITAFGPGSEQCQQR